MHYGTPVTQFTNLNFKTSGLSVEIYDFSKINNNYLLLFVRFVKRPSASGYGLYDPTIVMNRDNLIFYNREGFIKLGYYVLSFLIYLYK